MSRVTDHHVPETPCPYCGKQIDGAANVIGRSAPSPGDVSLCIYCAGILVFDDELRHVEPDAEQLAEALEIPELRYAQRAIQAMHADPSWENPP